MGIREDMKTFAVASVTQAQIEGDEAAVHCSTLTPKKGCGELKRIRSPDRMHG